MTLLWLALVGCAGGGSGAAKNDEASITPTTGASVETYALSARELIEVLPRAVKHNHWGLLRMDRKRDPFGAYPDVDHLTAQALTPDDRDVTIIAQRADEQRFNLHVRVGHWGDAPQEHAFYKTFIADLKKWRKKHKDDR